MSKHHSDLIMCRQTTGTSIAKVCLYCSDKCLLCESQVNLYRKARLCQECSFGYLIERCVVCNSKAELEAQFCYNCCLLERDREGCPKIVNMGMSRKDKFFRKMNIKQKEENVQTNKSIYI